MKINVGSKNKLKLEAVKDTLRLYPKLFLRPKVEGIEVSVPEFGHPKNIKETIKGAVTRAEKAFEDCDYSFGIEGGLIEVPLSKSGFMETNVCAIFDGKKVYLGLGPSFEWPPKVTKLITLGKADASRAFKQLGYTQHEKLGAVEGGITGFLTNGRLTREDFIKYSIIMALIRLENSQIY